MSQCRWDGRACRANDDVPTAGLPIGCLISDLLTYRSIWGRMPSQRGVVMAEQKSSVQCEECGFDVVSIAPDIQGRFLPSIHANDSNCKHPPATSCPRMRAALSRARTSTIGVGS